MKMNNILSQRVLYFALVLSFLFSCTPATEPTPTNIPTPLPTTTPTLLPTPSPTPIPWQKYKMTFLVEEAGYGKLWMPVPWTWEGAGMRNVEIVDISPEPADVYQDIQGNQIVFWNRSGIMEYGITFNIELSEIHYDIDTDNIGEYDTEDPDYIRYTSPSSRVESDDPRFVELAMTIIGTSADPYNQAKKIHQWVWTNINGNIDVPETAITTFEARKGACGGHSFLYIALLRSLGIPARNIGGITDRGLNTFQSGIWNGEENTIATHIWTEIYFPNYGWVQSDSTSIDEFLGYSNKRVILFRGEDILLGNGYPLTIIPWFHMPQTDFIGNSDPATQTIGHYLKLEVEKLDE